MSGNQDLVQAIHRKVLGLVLTGLDIAETYVRSLPALKEEAPEIDPAKVVSTVKVCKHKNLSYYGDVMVICEDCKQEVTNEVRKEPCSKQS